MSDVVNDTPMSAVCTAAGAFLESGDGPDGPAERALADVLEIWIADLLASDERWPLRDRWFDGLVFDRCTRADAGELDLSGVIWRILTQGRQSRVPFRASIRVGEGKIEGYDVEVGAEVAGDRTTLRHVQWLYRFAG